MSSKNLTLKDFEAHCLGVNSYPSPMASQCFCDSYERLLSPVEVSAQEQMMLSAPL